MSDMSQIEIDNLLREKEKYEDLLYYTKNVRDNIQNAKSKIEEMCPKFDNVYKINGKNMVKEKYTQIINDLSNQHSALVYTIIPAIYRKIDSINSDLES